MRDHLAERPVHVGKLCFAELHRRHGAGAHLRGGKIDLHPDRKAALRLIVRVHQIGQRLRIAFRARRLRGPERGQGFGGHHPGGDGGMKALGQKRAERLIFPRLHVPRRPIVEQTDPCQMVARVAYRNRTAQIVGPGNPGPQLQLEIQPFARAEAGRVRIGRLALPMGPPHRYARWPDGGSPAMITDRDMLVVRQQGIVRPEQLADIIGVMNTRVKIGIITDARGHQHRTSAGIMQKGFQLRTVRPVR